MKRVKEGIMMKQVNIGIIGCGNISSIYCEAPKKFPILNLVACADVDKERAKARAEQFHIPNVCTVEELLSDPTIDIVVNLTPPQVHAEICLKALEAGKHVYVEKPLAITVDEGKQILELAKEKGKYVGAAPDTFLGGGLQTCRKLIDDGEIGEVIGATAFMMSSGHESWHPDPEFYYKPGGGPMLDMGPYYLTALIHLIGPIRKVTGVTRISFPERTITSQPKFGQTIRVEVPTHVAGILQFENGAIGTILTTFDVASSRLPHMEIYGSKGTILAPDPNTFGGPVFVKRKEDEKWREVSISFPHTDNSRGLGVADMAEAILTKKEHRASGEMAFHVLEVMHGIHESSKTSSHYQLESTCRKPEPL